MPCITLRENTEWVETVQEGWNTLVGVNKSRILQAVGKLTKVRGHKDYPEVFGQSPCRNISAIIRELS